MANLAEMIGDAKTAVKNLQRKFDFKKANRDRAAAAKLQYELGVCRGKLEVCRKQFSRTILTQSNNIAQGRAAGIDTMLQEQILWDSAIGYLLVRDAIYALQSITSYDSVAHAYEMLDAAAAQISGQKSSGLSKLFSFGPKKERNAYGYITSSAAVKQKEAFLDTFFEELKETGDIEACLQAAENPAHKTVERERLAGGAAVSGRPASGGSSNVDQMMSRLRKQRPEETEEDIPLETTTDVRPPKDQA